MSSANLFKPDADQIKKICQIYERTEESLTEDVATLKNWIKTQLHLPEIMDEKMIRNFLFLNKFSIEKSKQRIDMYYTLRSKIPELYANMNPKCEKMRQMMEIGCWVPFPRLTHEGYRVTCFKVTNKHLVDKLDPLLIAGLLFDLYEIILEKDIIFGDIIIFDMEGLTWSYMTKLTPSALTKMVVVYEKIFSIPLKGLYLLNAPSFVGTVLALLKSALKPKLFDRVFTCEDTSILNERFPKEMLPKDYGGLEKSIQELQGMVNFEFQNHQNRFDKLDVMKVDEILRPEPLKNDEILGFYGNFKKLNVD